MSTGITDREPAAAPRSSPPTIARLWLLRLVVRSELIEELGDEWPDPMITAALKLSESAVRSRAKLQARLRAELETLERSDGARDDVIWSNLERLGDRLTLTLAERAVLALAAHAEFVRALQHALRVFEHDEAAFCRAIATAIACTPEDVRLALSPEGTLRGARMIRREPFNRFGVRSIALAPALTSVLRGGARDADAMLRAFFGPAGATVTLGPDNFPHLASDIDIAAQLLRGALRTRARGINILLHGVPGTGKTALSKVLAKLAGATLYEVSVTEEDGNAATESSRMAAYAVAQGALRAAALALILFDEMDGAVPKGDVAWSGAGRDARESKGWLCRMLEENAVPAVWVANRIDHLDQAYLRRFMLVLEVPPPPPAVRRTIVAHAFEGSGVSGAWIDTTVARRGLTPARLEQARKVLGCLHSEAGEVSEAVLDRVLDAAVDVTTDETQRDNFSVRLDLGGYDLSYVNSSVPLEDVVRGLANSRRASLLLHGPSGAGKTGFVAHLARKLGVPVLAKRASTVLSAWLGQTEKNLAEAFREAEREGAILFIDESDSFFGDRSRALRSWEVTQVNELLVQMEGFPGLFVCATNLLDVFDQAAIRRFDLKIRFDQLTADQRERLFIATLAELGERDGDRSATVEQASSPWRGRLRLLDGLTAGDYAAVARRVRVLGIGIDARGLISELELEHQLKRPHRVAGFSHGAA